jgi:hypothetical protein
MTDYNYRENPALVDALARGYRGAYWDILRRVAEGKRVRPLFVGD